MGGATSLARAFALNLGRATGATASIANGTFFASVPCGTLTLDSLAACHRRLSRALRRAGLAPPPDSATVSPQEPEGPVTASF